MDSLNSSLLISESIFVPIVEVDASISQNLSELHISTNKPQIEQEGNYYNSSNSYNQPTTPDPDLNLLMDNSKLSSMELVKPRISITQEEAMRLLHLAASLLQAHIKRYLQQKKYQTLRLKYHAAVKIQSTWRGYKTRNLDVALLQKKLQYLTSQLQRGIALNDQKYQDQFNLLRNQNEGLVKTLLIVINEVSMLKSASSRSEIIKDSNVITENIQSSFDSCKEEQIEISDNKPNTTLTNSQTLEPETESTGSDETAPCEVDQIKVEEETCDKELSVEALPSVIKENMIFIDLTETDSNSEFQNIEVGQQNHDQLTSSQSIDNISLPDDDLVVDELDPENIVINLIDI